MYQKMEGKSNPNALIYLNKPVVNDLQWIADHVKDSDGILLLEAIDWEPADADLVAYCDASLGGMGFYYPDLAVGCQSMPPEHAPPDNIFYLEALCVCWCIHHAVSMYNDGDYTLSTLTVFTDSENTFHIFNSLKAKPIYNEILKSAVDILIKHKIKLRVMLVQGKQNIVADALSRWLNSIALANCSGLVLDEFPVPHMPFTPPRSTLGLTKK